MSDALQHIAEPIANMEMENMSSNGRPNTSLIAARNGMATALERRYAVPTQKP